MKFLNWLKQIYLFPFTMLMGAVPGAPGSTDYTYSGGTDKRIPIAFSNRTLVKFYASTVIAQISNTD